jgi:hypothetical protein
MEDLLRAPNPALAYTGAAGVGERGIGDKGNWSCHMLAVCPTESEPGCGHTSRAYEPAPLP